MHLMETENEQTVGSLIFAPMLHVMSETNANDCQTCVVCARDVLDNNLFCSTCAGISFEGFGNFDNSDVLETQTGFNDVLDDSGKFSGLEEFWRFRPGLVGSLSGAEDAAESLVSPACARVQVFKPAVSTFLDLPATDTCSLSLFFRPTPDGSRQVVYQAGKTIAFCKFTELDQ